MIRAKQTCTLRRCRPLPRALRHLCVVALLAAPVRAAEVIDRVLAVVSGNLILQSDVRAAETLGLVDVSGAGDPTRLALTRLIDRSLVLDEVNRYAPPEPDAEAIAERVRIVRERFSSDAEFVTTLRRLGLDEAQLRELVRQNLRIQSYVDQRFATDTPERAQLAVADWIAGLRRRAEIVDVYVTGR